MIKFTGNHLIDANRNPAGGVFDCPGMHLEWAKDYDELTGVGPLKLSIAMVERLQAEQKMQGANDLLEAALVAAEKAKVRMEIYHKDRAFRGVIGTNQP